MAASAQSLLTREQATLLQYFSEKLARNLDLTDPFCHFRKVVPHRALICTPLLHAICAFSARHLSRTTSYDSGLSGAYYQQCVEQLMLRLTASSVVFDDAILASAVILQHLEELETPVLNQGAGHSPSHLSVIHTYINGTKESFAADSLQQAAVWAALRQEIYMAIVGQFPIALNLEHFRDANLHRIPEAFQWACRAVLLCAHVINHCFGEQKHDKARYQSLSKQLDAWWSMKPRMFEPLFHAPPDGNHRFGQQIFTSDEIPTGLQHYHLARILISAYDPQIPHCGIRNLLAQSAIDDETRKHVRALCALAEGNVEAAPNYISACIGILMCGERFKDLLDREALLQVLWRTESVHGWPTRSLQDYLISAWQLTKRR